MQYAQPSVATVHGVMMNKEGFTLSDFKLQIRTKKVRVINKKGITREGSKF
jgi:hypothetical protein